MTRATKHLSKFKTVGYAFPAVLNSVLRVRLREMRGEKLRIS